MHNIHNATALLTDIHRWAAELGFASVGVTGVELGEHPQHLRRWLDLQYHGDMLWMDERATLRSHPAQLVPGTVRVLSLRMDYLPAHDDPLAILADGTRAYIARYALGRDYHKVLRKQLSELAERIAKAAPHQYRVFTDSAPILERAAAQQAGLGWIGKNTMLIQRDAGSWFFLGEILTDLPLPIDAPHDTMHCGTCTACLDLCPTGAIIAPHTVDARKCISYLTIEYDGVIPEALRAPMGNRIFGCDDCQLVCPWNKFAQPTHQADFTPRTPFADVSLIELFAWDEAEFLQRTAGMPLRRISHTMWLRNIAIALGNALTSHEVVQALRSREHHANELVREHVLWALGRHQKAEAHYS